MTFSENRCTLFGIMLYAFFRRHRPQLGALTRVLAATPPSPSIPFVTSIETPIPLQDACARRCKMSRGPTSGAGEVRPDAAGYRADRARQLRRPAAIRAGGVRVRVFGAQVRRSNATRPHRKQRVGVPREQASDGRSVVSKIRPSPKILILGSERDLHPWPSKRPTTS